MKKSVLSLILCLLCFSAFALPAFAVLDLPYVDDGAHLLSEEEINALTAKAKQLSDTYQADIRILTVDSLGNSYADAYADWYYCSNGFRENGILLLISMSEREWYIYTSGDLIYNFNDEAIKDLGLEFTQLLANGEYLLAFTQYLDALPYYLDEKESTPNLLLSLAIGILAGGITVGILSASMNTKHKQTTASGYMQNNSFHLHTHQDLFLYSKTDKVRRQQKPILAEKPRSTAAAVEKVTAEAVENSKYRRISK